MGALFVKIKKGNTTGTIDCETDTACTAYGTAATQCCMHVQLVTLPHTAAHKINSGNESLKTINSTLGWPITVGEYSRYCNYDYPTSISSWKTSTSG